MHVISTEVGYAIAFKDAAERKQLIKNLEKMSSKSRVLMFHDVAGEFFSKPVADAVQKVGKIFERTRSEIYVKECKKAGQRVRRLVKK